MTPLSAISEEMQFQIPTRSGVCTACRESGTGDDHLARTGGTRIYKLGVDWFP